MSEINHHITDGLILSYAAGTLPEAFSLVIATHISMCDECRARLQSHEAVGGSLIETVGQAKLSDDALQATMDLIADEVRAPEISVSKGSGVFPSPLQDYVGGDLDAVKWRSVGGGVRQSLLETSDGASVRLLSIPGGAAMPDHSHRGMELTLVLQGAFRDEDGRFGPGDIEVADEEMHHTPIAEAGIDCICLAATDAPLRFKGLLPRIAQPFIGI